ncbi:hypothetical protein [Lentibacter sp. XHP0401]|jgi:hypothetical protein|uniref:hypothetical protein n=1 Tax=Lentibacter sp. XHP0401 TaxID=2984334 RepID=UPI0021E93756|nr:hypothetical protein [Lentibacter sp. XHP0401]MCV2892987.1 hypothetical protein [Lentibacter sp. XHP0401]
MLRRFFLLAALGMLAACANPDDLDQPAVDLGNFRLGHNIVVAPKFEKGPLSREKPKEEWVEAVTARIAERFDRYEGDKLYHFGVSLEGYVLAQPGIPVVASPKSALVIRITVWDDAANKKLNEKAHQIVVFEQLSGEQVIGSGLTQSAEEQLENLSKNAAKMIELWLVRQNASEGWFNDAPEDALEDEPEG